MIADDVRREVVGQWLAKADADLEAARMLLRGGRRAPLEAICFHAQQCVEKLLKATLVFFDHDFPKTHDISALLALLPRSVEFGIAPEDQRRLTFYATVTRYPGTYSPISRKEAKQAVKQAREARKRIRGILPKGFAIAGQVTK